MNNSIHKTYSAVVDYPYPLPAQKITLAPGNKVAASELESMHFTVLKGEQEFQPFEHVLLIGDGGDEVGIGQITTYSHNRVSDITEISFMLLAFKLSDGSFVCLSSKEVTEEFIKTPEATTLMTAERDEEEV